MEQILVYIINKLNEVKVRYEIYHFASKAVIIDIWIENNFYVIQIDDKKMGLSLIAENTAFDMTPDTSFTSVAAFKVVFDKMLN